MIERLRRFRYLEWLWVAYVAFCALIGITGEIVGGIGYGLLFEALLFPVGLLLGYWSFYSLLPDEFQVGVLALIVVLNGGLWYALLRVCFRRRPRTDLAAQGTVGEGPSRASGVVRRFGVLEWLWVAHTALWLVAGFVFIASQSAYWDVVVTSLGLPLGIVFLASPVYQELDQWVRAPLFALILFLNGGLWYGLLRFGPSRFRPVETPASIKRTALQAAVNFHLRWLRGELGDEPVWAHLLLAPALLWMLFGLFCPTAFIFTLGAVTYGALVTAVVVRAKRRNAVPPPVTGEFTLAGRTGLLYAQRSAFRMLLGLLLGLLVFGAYVAR